MTVEEDEDSSNSDNLMDKRSTRITCFSIPIILLSIGWTCAYADTDDRTTTDEIYLAGVIILLIGSLCTLCVGVLKLESRWANLCSGALILIGAFLIFVGTCRTVHDLTTMDSLGCDALHCKRNAAYVFGIDWIVTGLSLSVSSSVVICIASLHILAHVYDPHCGAVKRFRAGVCSVRLLGWMRNMYIFVSDHDGCNVDEA